MAILEAERTAPAVATPTIPAKAPKEPTPIEVASELLTRAKNRISEPGRWVTGSEVSCDLTGAGTEAWAVEELNDEEFARVVEKGAFCAIGAIRVEARLMGVDHAEAERLLGKAILYWIPEIGEGAHQCAIVSFNDRQSDKADVIAKFEDAIRLADRVVATTG